MSVKKRLRTWWDRVRTEPGLKRNVVAYVALLAVGFGAGGWILSNQQFTPPWSNDLTVEAAFEALPGIAPGNGQEVRVSGVMVGSISDAHVDDKGQPVVTMRIDPEVPIYKDAVLVLRPKSPLNEMYVTIDPGTPAAGRITDGHKFETASTRRPVQIDEVLGALDDQARTAMTSLLSELDEALASAPDSLVAGLDATGATLTTLQPVVAELDLRRDALQRLVTAISAITNGVAADDARLTALADALETTLGVVGDESGNLSATLEQLPALVDKLDGSTSAIVDLSAVLDPTLKDIQGASDVLPDALNRLEEVADPLQRTIDLATPVVSEAVPLVADLRPLAQELTVAVPMLQRTTARLDPVVTTLLGYTDDIGAFMVNTRSLTSLRDGNGGILRGMLTINTTTLPTDLLSVLTPELEGPLP